MKTQLNWQVGHTADRTQPPTEFVPATVPGAVQLDWARAHGWPQPEYDPDVSKYAWIEDVYWLYRAPLTFDLAAGERLFFVCKGVDYQFEIRLNGEILHEQEGMFTPVELDLTESAKTGDVLEVLVFPAPKSCATPVDRNQANQSCKPTVSYEWDFHPRLIPLGIWDETVLETRPAAHIRFAEVMYEFNADLSQVTVHLTAGFENPMGQPLRWRLLAPSQAEVIREVETVDADVISVNATLAAPVLWWPNGQGEPARYTSIIELLDHAGHVVQTQTQMIGFRQVKLVMHPTQWQEKEVVQFPKGRHTSPITLQINGRAIFAKGSNWVTPTMFPGTLTKDFYREQLQLAKDANMNIVRCWGGANVQKEAFFELCDELGLMVWQEFPLACNRYEGTPEYLQVLDQESKSIIRRLRQHPSVLLWCGGNELFNNWSKMTDQDLALRLLNRNCYDLDPNTPFLMTSPSMGMAHGGYFFRRADGAEVYQYFAQSHATAYTEFGVTAPANVEVLKKIIPEAELFPPKPGTQWQVRHAFKAWEPHSWLDLPTIRDYFGEAHDLEQLVEWGQWLQSEGYKAIFEEARRQKPVCSMALNWCLNEPWPTAANNSLISWPTVPKPALQAVAQACRPTLASARIPKFSWHAGETFSCDVFLLNDAPMPVEGDIEVLLYVGGAVLALGEWDNARAEANQNAVGPTLRVVLPDVEPGEMRLAVRVENKPEWDSEYRLLLK